PPPVTTEPVTAEPPTVPPVVTPDTPTDVPTTGPTVSPPIVTTVPPPITVEPVTPVVGANLLTNADFEGDGGWVFGDTPFPGAYDSAVVRGGSRAVRLGITSGNDAFSFSSIWQRVTIPAEAQQVTLTAQVYPISQDTADSGDVQVIAILDAGFKVKRKLSVELSNSQTWETKTFNLSDLAGQTVYIYFSVFNRGRTNLPTAMYVDDVALTWSN
ncbi:MAG: hypothetical protein R3264_18155, partial [Anaerolineae bacterium]|nr:hypothetical protein [Anaerolineae bacterium]